MLAALLQKKKGRSDLPFFFFSSLMLLQLKGIQFSLHKRFNRSFNDVCLCPPRQYLLQLLQRTNCTR